MDVLGYNVSLESEDFAADDFQVFAVTGTEALSRLFSFDIDLVHGDPHGLDVDELIGATATLVFEFRPQSKDVAIEYHRVHGMIAEIEDMIDPHASYRTYRLHFVPRAHRLTLIQTHEVYLNQTVPDIIRTKLGRVGLDSEDFDFRLSGSYPEREFVVQYKETDLAFVCRLAEHLGITFFFEHDSGRDVMVFTDDNVRFRPIEGSERVDFRSRGEASSVYELRSRSKMIPSTYVVQDYNYRLPQLDIMGQHQVAGGYAGGVLEYAPNYLTPEAGATFARTRAEERAATRRVITGESDIYRFHAGAKFKLEEHPRFEPAHLLLVEVVHKVRQVIHLHGGKSENLPFYENAFRAIDIKVPYRPPRVTPKPVIAGVLCARVEPRTDADIGHYAQIDEWGRYTIRFFFDPSPLGARPQSSLPVRMAQPHAGPNYGFHFPLKPGVEVLVAFDEGDPDRPFIVGAVPNPITPSPVDRHNSLFNRFQSVSGAFFEIKDV